MKTMTLRELSYDSEEEEDDDFLGPAPRKKKEDDLWVLAIICLGVSIVAIVLVLAITVGLYFILNYLNLGWLKFAIPSSFLTACCCFVLWKYRKDMKDKIPLTKEAKNATWEAINMGMQPGDEDPGVVIDKDFSGDEDAYLKVMAKYLHIQTGPKSLWQLLTGYMQQIDKDLGGNENAYLGTMGGCGGLFHTENWL